MKRTLTLGFGLIVVLFFTSCEREESMNIDQSRIYTNYTYTYDSNKSQAVMTATFRLDNSTGDKLELSYPARVEFGGENMSWRSAFGYYDLKRNGNMSQGAFTYHDLDDNSFTNNISAIESIELPFGLTSINKNGNFFLPWDGQALRSGERIKVTIKGGDQLSSKEWTTSTTGATHIILDENKLKQLSPGTAEVQIEREITQALQQSGLAGGRIEMQYKSRKVTVNITD